MDSIFFLVHELFELALATEELVHILSDCSKLVDCQNDRSVLPFVKKKKNKHEKLTKRLQVLNILSVNEKLPVTSIHFTNDNI